ncbi:hypothetical protein [Gordonia sp. NPDC058843]|uniref:hypothetical protein n=1 Tax=Gordonia sp. NPDC058843 TaxID=3346648 RepID=UPI00367E92A9
MVERVRIAAEVSAIDYAARFGYAGRTLGNYLAEFGGHDGYVEDPYGTRQWVSLRAFDGADPDLFLKIMFIVPEIPGDDFPALYSDAVILKEYVLPEGTVVPR